MDPKEKYDEGWAPGSFGSQKWHYYRDGRSLCGRYGWIGALNFEQGNDQSPDNCAACRKKREKEEGPAR